jgi:hypothetical protein
MAPSSSSLLFLLGSGRWGSGREVLPEPSDVSVVLGGKPLIEDGASALQTEAARGLQEIGQGLRRTQQGLDDVERRSEWLIEVTERTGRLAGQIEKGISIRRRLRTEPENRIAPCAREDGGGEQRVGALPENGGRARPAGTSFAAPEERESAAEEWLDVPGAGSIGLGGGGRLIALADPLQKGGVERVGEDRAVTIV